MRPESALGPFDSGIYSVGVPGLRYAKVMPALSTNSVWCDLQTSHKAYLNWISLMSIER